MIFRSKIVCLGQRGVAEQLPTFVTVTVMTNCLKGKVRPNDKLAECSLSEMKIKVGTCTE